MPNSVTLHLRGSGHDVVSAKESMRGADDISVLARAQLESRILLSQDKDFGELAFRSNLPAESGIILFRLSGEFPGDDQHRMIEAIESRDDWAGTFSVVDDTRIRMRPLLPKRGT
jgi:predicted nuclease of predicted toxin-antitoxin system